MRGSDAPCRTEAHSFASATGHFQRIWNEGGSLESPTALRSRVVGTSSHGEAAYHAMGVMALGIDTAFPRRLPRFPLGVALSPW